MSASEKYVKLVQEILVGSDKINQMRREVEILVGMILSMIKPEDFLRFYPEGLVSYRDPSHPGAIRWTICCQREAGKEIIVAECSVGDSTHCLYDSHDRPFSARNIQRVHRQLPLFLETAIRFFPDLRASIQPFLNAGRDA